MKSLFVSQISLLQVVGGLVHKFGSIVQKNTFFSGGFSYKKWILLCMCMFVCTIIRTCQCFVWKKTHFPALVGPEVAIFGRDDFDPLYFDVSNFSVPPDPPICLKIPKCAFFTTFWESHLKHFHKVGVRREKFNIGNCPQFFSGTPIYVGSWPLNFRNISQWKIFHRQRQRHRHRSPVDFLRFDWKT